MIETAKQQERVIFSSELQETEHFDMSMEELAKSCQTARSRGCN